MKYGVYIMIFTELAPWPVQSISHYVRLYVCVLSVPPAFLKRWGMKTYGQRAYSK